MSIYVDADCTLGIDREYDLTTSALLAFMDEAGVAKALVAPVDRLQCVDNAEGNAFIARAAAAHSDRLIATCTANPWYGRKACEELRCRVNDGARMLVLNPFVQGYQANDELVWPLLEASATERIPVYIHTGTPGNATPWQIVDLAVRYPELDLIMGHCGATDFWNDVVPACSRAPNITLESSNARPFLFANYLAVIGPHRGVVGSAAPLTRLTFEWEQMRTVMPPTHWNAVAGGNMMRLLEKRGPL